MRIIRTIKYPESERRIQPTLVDPEFPVHYLPVEDQVRAGFEKGTLKRVTFELENGHTIIYESKEKD